VQLDRRNRRLLDSAAVREKFGVDPESIPDYLALVGDSADGFPGLPGWGAKSAAALLGRYGHIEQIPADPRQWDVPVRSAVALAETLHQLGELALHFRLLATLRVDAPVGTVDAWEWTGPVKGYDEWSARLGSDSLARRVAARVAARDKGSA
jgi:5'-3' exonuclease